MNPVMLHADGTDCLHEGAPQAGVLDEGGPLCPAGLPVTHVRFNGKVLTVEEALASLKSVADTFARMITPIIAAFANLGRLMSSDPGIRALVAASDVVNDARREESQPDYTKAE